MTQRVTIWLGHGTDARRHSMELMLYFDDKSESELCPLSLSAPDWSIPCMLGCCKMPYTSALQTTNTKGTKHRVAYHLYRC